MDTEKVFTDPLYSQLEEVVGVDGADVVVRRRVPDGNDAKVAISQDLAQVKDHNAETFVITIPTSELSRQDHSDVQVKLKDFLKPPNTDEVQLLARDGQNGGLKKLSQAQLDQIHAEGKFTVPSEQFAPQLHVWEVKNFFQKGVKDSTDTFHNGIALCTQHFVIYIPNRLWRHEAFSFWAGLKSLITGVIGIAVQIIGSVERKTVFPHDSEKDAIRLDTLLGNWLSDPDSIKAKDVISGKVKRVSTFEGFTITTDLTFGDSDVRQKLKGPYEAFMKSWEIDAPQRRQKIAKELAGSYPSDELAQEVINAEALELQENIFKLIHSTLSTSGSSNSGSLSNDNNTDNRDDDNAEAKDLCNLILAVQLIRDAMKHYRLTRENALHIYMQKLREGHKILSRLPKWLDLKRETFLKSYEKEHPVAQEIATWSEKLTGQEKYIFDANLAAEADVQRNIKNATKKEPGKIFEWAYHIWRPSHYRVEKHDEENGHTWYELSKYNKFQTTSSYPGWRFGNIILRIGQYFANGLRGLIAWSAYGPLGVRSLVGLDDYQPDKTVDRQTGELVPTGSFYATWFGRIRNLWRHIRKCVDDFNSKPDNGTFGKSLQRPFVVGFWNYFCKGVLGTLFSLIGHPILTALNLVVSGALIVTSPVWSIGLSILRYLVDLFLYDFDAPTTDVSFFNPQAHQNQYESREWFPLPRLFFGDVLVLGLGRMIAAPLVAVGNVAVGSIGYLLSALRYGLTRTWDNIMYYCLWKPFGRVPNRNDYFSTRISGPGLSMTYFQVIKPDLGILMIKYLLEKDRVNLVRSAISHDIDEPSRALREYYAQFKDLGLIEDASGTLTKSFSKTKSDLYKRLDDAIRSHFDSLIVDGTLGSSHNVRMTKDDLLFCITSGTEVCQLYCERHQSQFPENWWSSKGVVVGDYENLAIHFLKMAFGSSIIQPIEEADPAGFRINIDESTLPKYVKMVCKGTTSAFNGELESTTVDKPLIADDKYPSSPTNITIVTPFNMSMVDDQERLVTLRKIDQSYSRY